MLGHVALLLHAHLPYVRHPEHERPLEERWLHEALIESYLPIVDMLDRLGNEGIHAPFTLSLSPTLLAMLGDELLRARFVAHLDRAQRLAARLLRGDGIDRALLAAAGCSGAALPFLAARLADVRAIWDRCNGNVVGALVRHADAGRIELVTTTATHAYLPGLLPSPASIRAQLRLGLRYFERVTGRRSIGLWLPECAYDPRLAGDLAASGVRYTVLDAHGLELARPRPPFGATAPVIGRGGVAYFARDPAAARDVWSRTTGYPGDPTYREFYRDVGFDLPEQILEGELGPNGTRLMTGLKLHRITGPGLDKQPYDPGAAAARARVHAEHFVSVRETALTSLPTGNKAPLLVAPFDAELFGHWWFEGPIFLEHTLRALAASAAEGRIAATTLGGYLQRFPEAAVAEPAASTWGEGGFGEVWTGPAAARLLRHVHQTERLVRRAVARRRDATGLAGHALEQAVRELLLLESSDWPFMLHRGDMAGYAEARAGAHAHRAARLAKIAEAIAPTMDDLTWVHAVASRDRFLGELTGEDLRDAFDPWSNE
ncbi:MAG: 1,4-alpha-glucan branching protein domain-containing protein [Byssovorax sp.]